MKKAMRRFLIIIGGLLFPLCVNAQWFDSHLIKLDAAKLVVKYELNYVEDTNNIQHVGRETMILLIGDEISSFQSLSSFMYYQVGRKKREEGSLNAWIESGSFMQYKSQFTYCLYKNYPYGKITTLDDLPLSDSRFLYEEDMEQFVWEVFDEIAEIDGYVCQKAKCDFGGRTWEAWFTVDLPFSDGPYKFNGLPGLILKLEDMKKHYSFTLLSIETLQEEIPIELESKDYTRTTKQKFFEALGQSVLMLDDNDVVDSKVAEKIKQVLRSRNNPIELDRK